VGLRRALICPHSSVEPGFILEQSSRVLFFSGSVLFRRAITLDVHPTEVDGVGLYAFSLPSYDLFLPIHTLFPPIHGIPSDNFEFGFVVRDSIHATSVESPFVSVSVRLASECMLTFRSAPGPGMRPLVCGILSYCRHGFGDRSCEAYV